jgi:hypothetical protein
LAALDIDIQIYPLSVVVHYLKNNVRCKGSNFLSYRLLQNFHSKGTLFVNLFFEVAPEKKKLQWVKSGKRGGHPISPRKEISCPENISFRTERDPRDVWAVALFC